MHRTFFSSLVCLLAAVVPAVSAQQSPDPRVLPTAFQFDSLTMGEIDQLTVPPIDRVAVGLEDETREALGLAPRYAIPNAVQVRPDTAGTFEQVDAKTILWRLRVHAPDAVSINLGFGTYFMPVGGQLMIYSADGRQVVRPFTDADNEVHGQLWTPLLRTDEVVIEVTLPTVLLDDLQLELTQVGYGYRGFGTKAAGGAGDSGPCNVDVVCADGDEWRNEIPAIGVISLGGSTFCTGFMVNNTSNDRTPYFMTARHCGIAAGNAPSLVVYWNFETSTCGGAPDGQLSEFNSGSQFRAGYTVSDFTLVELDDVPDPAFGVTFAGWDRSGDDEPGAVVIHHPNTDEKSISFENQPTTTTSWGSSFSPGDGTHVRIADWDVGTTEPGSSGSPLFNLDHQIIGQLHGGAAACGNNLPDWFGKFAFSWEGGGTPSTRLRDWLDAAGTGAVSVNTLGGGMVVQPSAAVIHKGPEGGPFTHPTVTYQLTNNTNVAIDYSVSLSFDVGVLIDGGTAPVTGTLAAFGGTAQLVVTLAALVDSLPAGSYAEEILFEDLTDGISITRSHTIQVGFVTAYSFALDTDPGWTTEGLWAFGVPSGAGGGQFGFPDPTSGFTGDNVYGFHLGGNYVNNLPIRHLTSTAIDCTGLANVSVRFQRWLNVEQALFDHASFSVSNDGSNFTTVWENVAEVTDSDWVLQEFDISAVADGQPTVYLRWTMGPTDASFQFSGWNIDDIEIDAMGPPSFTLYGRSLAGSGGFKPSLRGAGDASLGGSFEIDLVNGLGGAVGQLLIGFQRVNIPFKGGFLLVPTSDTTRIPIVLSGPVSVPRAGQLHISGGFTDPGMAGTTFQLQTLIFDTGAIQGVALSNGLEVFIGF